MIIECPSRGCRVLAVIASLIALAPSVAGAEPAQFTFAYLQRDDDPYYAPHRAYTGLVLRDRKPALAGAKVALRESHILSRALGLEFALRERVLAAGDDVIAVIDALAGEGITAFLLDLPLADVTTAAAALAGRDVMLFNIRHTDDRLRGADCSPALFHTIPSDAMLMDALTQYLVKKNWTEVLVLEGDGVADKRISAAFQASARKFRLEVTAVREFVLSNDPRLRDQTNIPILTGGIDYDVVFIADELGEVGRYIPYNTLDPRPVVGSEGLTASAWHWTWERHGAPQLDQRFDRSAGRRMVDADWAAWAAVKSVVAAIVRTGSTDVPGLAARLTDADFTLDMYKGSPGSFRPWDHQLRQAILLHTHNAVVARAPIDGFLHEVNNLDTLGADLRESTCRFP